MYASQQMIDSLKKLFFVCVISLGLTSLFAELTVRMMVVRVTWMTPSSHLEPNRGIDAKHVPLWKVGKSCFFFF